MSCCLCWVGHRDKGVSFHAVCPEGAPAEVGTAAFFGERAASAEECLFRLLTSLMPSAWLDRPAWLLACRRLLKSFSVTVYVPYSAL
jgi:hypothetical protein